MTLKHVLRLQYKDEKDLPSIDFIVEAAQRRGYLFDFRSSEDRLRATVQEARQYKHVTAETLRLLVHQGVYDGVLEQASHPRILERLPNVEDPVPELPQWGLETLPVLNEDNMREARIEVPKMLANGSFPIFVIGLYSHQDRMKEEMSRTRLSDYFRHQHVGPGETAFWHPKLVPAYEKGIEEFGEHWFKELIHCGRAVGHTGYMRRSFPTRTPANPRFFRDYGGKKEWDGFYTLVDDLRLGQRKTERAIIGEAYGGNKTLGRAVEGVYYRFFVVGADGLDKGHRSGPYVEAAIGIGRLDTLQRKTKSEYRSLLAILRKDPMFLVNVLYDFLPEMFDHGNQDPTLDNYHKQAVKESQRADRTYTMHIDIPELQTLGMSKEEVFIPRGAK
jgi:hypothetical protein